MSTEEREIGVYRLTKGRWVFILVASILAATYGSLVQFFITWGGHQFQLEWDNTFIRQAIGLLALLIIVNRFILSRFPKIKLNAQDLLIMYGAFMTALPLAGGWWYRMNIAPLMGIQFRPPWKDEVIQYISKHFGLWVPSTDVCAPALYGGVSVPWGELAVPILFWALYAIGTYFFAMGGTLMLRRRWIDVERLTFPLALPPAVAATSSLATDEESKHTWRVIFYVVGIFWLMSRPIAIINAFRPGTIILPPGPIASFGIWNFLNLSFGSFDIPWNLNRYEGWWTYMLPNVPLCFTFPSFFIAALYLVPLEVLNGVLLGYGIFQFLYPMIAYHMGWLDFFPPQDHSYWHQTVYHYNNGFRGSASWNPLMPEVMFQYGGLLALAIFPIILGWGDMKKVFSCILHPDKEFEASEPISYRYTFLMMVGGLVLLLILWGISGANVGFGFLMCIIAGLYAIGCARTRGESGIVARIFSSPNLTGIAHHLGLGLGVFPGVTDVTPRIDMGQAYFTNMWLAKCIGANPATATLMNYTCLGMETFKLSDLSRSSVKDQFIANTAAVILTSFIGLILTHYLSYTFGIMNGAGYRFWFSSVSGVSTPAGTFHHPAVGPYGFAWPQIVAGFLLVGAIFFLRLRFPWFAVSPAGMVLGNNFTIGQNILPCQVLVAWLFKVITFRVGGTRLYRKWGMPIAIGLVLGNMLNSFTSNIINIILNVAPWLRVA